MKKSLKKVGVFAVAAALLVGATVGVSAYFTDTDSSTNTWTVGKITIVHKEPEWDELPDPEKEDITPGKEFAKDPQIENTGENAAFVFQTVEVPVATVITAQDNGTRNPEALTDLFSYTVNEGWTQIGTVENVMDGSDVVAHKYTYVYGSATACTSLAAGVTTPTLFDTIKFANVIEDEGLETTTQSVKINAYGIQTSDLGASDTTTPSEVLQIIYNQAL